MSLDSLALVHRERRSEKRAVVEVVQIKRAFLAVHELADVAGEVHGGVVLDGGDGHLLDPFDREIDVEPVLPVIDMAVVIDLVDLAIFTGRVVHYHDVVALEIRSDIFIVEGFRSVGLGADEVALGVVAGPLELDRRLAEAEDEHPVDLLEHLCLHGRAVLGGCPAKLEAILAQFGGYLSTHLRRVVGAVGLRHDI